MRTIFDTFYGRANKLESEAKSALAFITKHRNSVMLHDSDIRALKTLRGYQTTPLVDQFTRITEETNLDHSLFMDMTDLKDASIPTLLTMDELSIDGRWLKAPRDLSSLWINLTPVTGKRASSSAPIKIADVSRMMGYVVRSHYCRGYASRRIWLPPVISQYVMETFSMAAQLRIARMYNLDAEDAVMVRTAMAYHYAKCLGEEDKDVETVPTLLTRAGFLGSYAEILRRIKIMEDIYGGPIYQEGIKSLCEALAAAGPQRLSDRFNHEVLYRIMSMGAADNTTLSVSVDYPPYWVFMLLNYASGSKNGTMHILFNMTHIKRKLDNFITQLTKNRTIAEDL